MAEPTEGTPPVVTPETTPPVVTPVVVPETPPVVPATPVVTPGTVVPPVAPQTGTKDVADVKAEADAETTKALADSKVKTTELELDLARERAARKYNLPDSLVPLLRAGQVDADAKALSTHSTAQVSGLGAGGLDPTDATDPKAEGKRLADRLFNKHRFF